MQGLEPTRHGRQILGNLRFRTKAVRRPQSYSEPLPPSRKTFGLNIFCSFTRAFCALFDAFIVVAGFFGGAICSRYFAA